MDYLVEEVGLSNEEIKYQAYIEARRAKYGIQCMGYFSMSTPDFPSEFDCEYEKSAGFGCEECICNGGRMNPVTGKRVYKRGE